MKRISALMQVGTLRTNRKKEGRIVSNMELNAKRFNEKCKRNYITIITVEYQCGTEMEGDILISAGNYRSRQEKKLYVNCLVKRREKKEKKIKEGAA